MYLANAVARIDNLEFLSDVVPRTISYKDFKAKKASKGAGNKTQALQAGQTTLDGNVPGPEQAINVSPEESQGPNAEQTTDMASGTNGNIVFQHYEPNGHAKRDESTDVEML